MAEALKKQSPVSKKALMVKGEEAGVSLYDLLCWRCLGQKGKL